MNRLLIVPGIALLAGGLYFVFSDHDSSEVAKSGVSITLSEPTPIGSSKIGTTTVTDAVEFKVVPVTIPSAGGSADKESQSKVIASDEKYTEKYSAGYSEEHSGKSERSAEVGSAEVFTSSNDANSEATPAAGNTGIIESDSIESVNVENDQPQQISEHIESDLIKHEVVVDSSLYQATNDAGLSANQTARIGKIIATYLDVSKELRKGDKLVVFLDPAAGDAGNDADQVHRLEYFGARKNLVITRLKGSLNDYQVGDGAGMAGNDGTSPTLSSSSGVEEETQQLSEQPAPVTAESAADSVPASDNMRRVEGVISVSFFAAAREAGLNAGQVEKVRKILTPYINFNREIRKDDRFVVMLDGGDVHSCEYIGAVKQLLATRDGQGAYKVTDKTGVDITVAESADISGQIQNTGSIVAKITQSKPPAKKTASSLTRSGGNSREESQSTSKVARVKKAEPQANPGIKQQKTSKPVVKIAGTEKKHARHARQTSIRSTEKHGSGGKSGTKKPFWKNLGFGSSKAAGRNWKPKDRKLAKVFDKVAASGNVERKALVSAFKYYQENKKSSGLGQTHIAIADYTKLATTKRLHIINLKTAGITSVQVAHGRKSGPIGGRVTSTSNANGSNKTTKGFYKVGVKEGRTSTKNLPYLSVQGLESHNRLVGLPPRKGGRDIIIHTAGYVASGGRSLGCFSIRPQDKRLVFNKLKGVLFYSYVG